MRSRTSATHRHTLHLAADRNGRQAPRSDPATTENRRIPFDPQGRLAPILKRRSALGSYTFVFGSPDGEFQDSFKTAWESLLLVANGHDTKRAKPGVRVDRAKLKRIASIGTICVTKAPADS